MYKCMTGSYQEARWQGGKEARRQGGTSSHISRLTFTSHAKQLCGRQLVDSPAPLADSPGELEGGERVQRIGDRDAGGFDELFGAAASGPERIDDAPFDRREGAGLGSRVPQRTGRGFGIMRQQVG